MFSSHFACIVLGLEAAAATIDHAGGNSTFHIVSTAESRKPNEVLYIASSSGRGEGALKGWTYEEGDEQTKFHLFPVAGETDVFYMVGTAESRKPGYMTYLGNDGKPEAWPFHPDKPDTQCQWRFVVSELSTDGPSYFIVSTSSSRRPNEMILCAHAPHGPADMTSQACAPLRAACLAWCPRAPVDDFGRVIPWGFDSSDDKCLWRLIPALPSPPLPNPNDVAEQHAQGYILGPLILVCCCACAACNRKSEQRRRTRARATVATRQLSSGRLPIPVGAPTTLRIDGPAPARAHGQPAI